MLFLWKSKIKKMQHNIFPVWETLLSQPSVALSLLLCGVSDRHSSQGMFLWCICPVPFWSYNLLLSTKHISCSTEIQNSSLCEVYTFFCFKPASVKKLIFARSKTFLHHTRLSSVLYHAAPPFPHSSLFQTSHQTYIHLLYVYAILHLYKNVVIPWNYPSQGEFNDN